MSIPPRALLLPQLLLTLVLIALPISNWSKLLCLGLTWAISFGKISRADLVLYVGVCLLFIGMNSAALSQGIFSFSKPDLLGMPAYEFFMWGYYVLHTQRFVDGKLAEFPSPFIWILAALYMAAFSFIPDPFWLLVATGILLIVALTKHHEPLDLAYFGYMLGLGALVEYTGVWSGQWQYPGNPPLGVPLWFITLWGGVGFFLHRLAQPLVARFFGPPQSRVD